MSVVWHFARPEIPGRALSISLLALSVPVAQTLWFGGPSDQPDVLLWLLALIPAFLLAYYRGWRGASIALALGMVLLTGTNLLAVWMGQLPANWSMLLSVTVVLAAVSLGAGWLSESLHRQRAAAERLALTDDLTGIWNRRRARMALEQAFARFAGQDTGLAVVMFDIDRFKAFNDVQGHAAGDRRLRIFAETLSRTTRKPDLSARYGGEEFLSILCFCDEAGAIAFAERVRTEFQAAQPEDAPLTVCAGIAVSRRPLSSPNDLLSEADQALYQAKKAGRDCVRVSRTAEPERQAG